MEGNSGISRARVQHALRANTRPSPVEPHDLAAGPGDSDVSFSEKGTNLTKSTDIVMVRDAAAADETATVTGVTVVPSGQNTLGTIAVDISFVNLPGATANLFRMYLTGPHGQRTFLGTVSSTP